jgi:hypothetical protein
VDILTGGAVMKTMKVLGTGGNSHKLAELVLKAAHGLGIDYRLEKYQSEEEAAAHGVIITPALIIDDNVVFSGDLPTVEMIKAELIK